VQFLWEKNQSSFFPPAPLYKTLNVGSDHSYLVNLVLGNNGEMCLFQYRLHIAQNLCSFFEENGDPNVLSAWYTSDRNKIASLIDT
jgi:hypothetical protein